MPWYRVRIGCKAGALYDMTISAPDIVQAMVDALVHMSGGGGFLLDPAGLTSMTVEEVPAPPKFDDDDE